MSNHKQTKEQDALVAYWEDWVPNAKGKLKKTGGEINKGQKKTNSPLGREKVSY